MAPARASRRGPIDPRLLQRARATRGYLILGVLVGCATAGLTIVQAWALAHALGDIFETQQLGSLAWAVPLLAAVFGAKGLLAWWNQWLAHRTAAAVKSTLRRDIMAARLARPIDSSVSSASLITLITQGLDALDGYFSKYLPQLMLALTVPAIITVAILIADPTSALIVVVTLPLIPIFMALVGWTTEARMRKRWRIQTRLANHFADLVLGLPTLQVFGRATAQAEGLRRSEAAHRRETMGTLRISFLSAMVLELLATLSVAIVAVAMGFRVVFYEVDLITAFFVLILAPEAYLPVRQVGVHYHDAADGVAAAEAAFAVIDPPVDPDAAPASNTPDGAMTAEPGPSERALLSVRDLEHTYPGAASPALQQVSFEVTAGHIVALTGPSGGGKTTLLNALIGFLKPTSGGIWVEGRPLHGLDQDAWRAGIAYVGQHPGMITGTVGDNVRLGDPEAGEAAVRSALDRAGGPELSPWQRVGDGGEGLSAGERRRVAVARALLRIDTGRARLLLLDEPTAGLDAAAEATLLGSLRGSGTTAVVVSHRPAVLAAADRVIEVGR
ncbi:MAG: thiol reductant ABC exporter subunit CydD [Micropruina sp.]|nr:thiol reductant ABC exporter subunit CydD [Micropruina sp.]